MTHLTPNRVKCLACISSTQEEAKFCHECKGKRFIEQRGVICNGKEVVEAMTGGWECETCGASGHS